MLAQVKGNLLEIRQQRLLTQGSVGETLEVSFSEDWAGLAVTAIFSAGSLLRDVLVDGDTLSIPWELFREAAHPLFLNFHGAKADGSIVMRTNIASLGVILPSRAPVGESSEPPSPTLVDQIQAAATEALAVARSVRSDADSGAFNGQDGTSPSARVSKSGKTTTIEITDQTGTTTATLQDGEVSREEFDQQVQAATDLKCVIEDFTELVMGRNIFDQASSSITEGKYLNYTNGNIGTNANYCYINEYIPVKPGTTYYGTAWNKTSGALSGPYNQFILFYDKDKQFLRGLTGNSSSFTTPEECSFMRLSPTLAGYNNQNYLFEEGSTPSASFTPYTAEHIVKLPFYVVDSGGKGAFTRINDAVQAAPSGSVILVAPGLYEENVKAWEKKIHIIGMSREACIIKDSSGNYSSPPVEIGAGSLQNLSIIEAADGAGTDSMGAYAIHVDSNLLAHDSLLLRNCYIYSDSSSAIGMGLRNACSVRIEDCEIVCAGSRVSTGAAPLYFHDADFAAYRGTANLYLHGNVLRNLASTLFSLLTINSLHPENETYLHMMYNIFVRSKTPALPEKFNTWNSSGNTDADGWNGLSHMYLEDDSFGNNLAELNYTT